MSDEQDYKAKYELLVSLINSHAGIGIYPLGHMTKEQQKKAESTDEYKCGWDAALIANLDKMDELIDTAKEGLDEDRAFLLAMKDDVLISEDNELMLNMNDTWGWALAWCPTVPKDQIPEVARLFKTYGRAGLMYWHSCQEKDMKSEFADNNRAIEFVRHEEQIRKDHPDHNRRAYHKATYTIGAS